MKKLMITAWVTLLAAGSGATLLPAETEELGLSGYVDFDTAFKTEFALDVTYGYFILDNFELGGKLAVRDNDFGSVLGLNVFGEYNLDTGTDWVPYVGAWIGYAMVEAEVSGAGGEADLDESAFVIGLEPGIKYFLLENLALGLGLRLEAATEDIYPEEDDVGSVDARLQFGVRYFF